jgi:hypothetical protein
MKTKVAIGCLVQWYEIEMVEEYIQSLRNALDLTENKENIILDFVLVTNQELEKINDEITMEDIESRFMSLLPVVARIKYKITDKLYTIADYRRDFNHKYCTEVDVLMWGESDSLIPKQTFQILDNLHQMSLQNNNPKYLAFFGICKMWDDSWKSLEHPDFTDKPFKDLDFDNWWQHHYTMSEEEMDTINDKTDELDVIVMPKHKFNGCGLIISSEVVRAGANIPKSVFFTHEDSAFMFMTNKILGNIPQYVIKNILLVHNRHNPKKRRYVKSEFGDNLKEQRLSNDWYKVASKMSEKNSYNLFNENYISYGWEDVWQTIK